MTRPPRLRFLGLGEDATDHELLGLPAGSTPSEGEIRDALQSRLRYLDRHPGGTGDDAIVVREALLAAALRIAGLRPDTPSTPDRVSAHASPVPPRSPGPPGGITDFDREILAILVGNGGWNPASRGSLVALAARHGVHPSAFLRIIQGLSRMLHDGQFAQLLEPEVASRPSGATTLPARRAPFAEAEPTSTSPRSHARARRGRSSTPWLLLLPLLLAGTMALVGAMLLLSRSAPSPAIPAPPDPVPPVEPPVATEASIDPGVVPVDPVRPGPAATAMPTVGEILWSPYPAFDSTGALPLAPTPLELQERRAALDRLSGRIEITRGLVGRDVVEEYGTLVLESGTQWPLLDSGPRYQLIRSNLGPLLAARDPAVRVQLLEVLEARLEDASGALDPSSLWLRGWISGLLGTLVGDPDQPKEFRWRIRRIIGGADLDARSTTLGVQAGFDRHAGRSLDDSFEDVLGSAIARRPGTGRLLESWLLAERAVQHPAVFESVLLDAITLILSGGTLSPGDGVVTLLAALVRELELRRATNPELVLLNFEDWFGDPELDSRNLNILTNLVRASGTAPWWDASMVLEADARPARREAFVATLRGAWPRSGTGGGSRGVPIEVADLLRIDELMRLTERQRTTDLDQMRRLLVSGEVSAATSAFVDGDRQLGLRHLARAEALWDQPPLADGIYEPLRGSGTDGSKDVGSAGDPRFRVDGSWRRAWTAAGSDLSARRAILRELGQFPPDTGLGPRDAGALAEAALRYHPTTRSIAQEVILEHFPQSEVIMLGLLNAFEGRRNRDVAEFLNRLLARESLPERDSGLWPQRVRVALVRNALLLQTSDLHDVENLSDLYVRQLVRRLEQASKGLLAVGLDESPQELLAQYAALLLERARAVYVTEPVPATLEELARRKVLHRSTADTPLKLVVAELLDVAGLSAYLTAALRPDLGPELERMHLQLLREARTASSVLEQMIILERAIARYTSMQLQATGEAAR